MGNESEVFEAFHLTVQKGEKEIITLAKLIAIRKMLCYFSLKRDRNYAE
jgi:hypothetical protein